MVGPTYCGKDVRGPVAQWIEQRFLDRCAGSRSILAWGTLFDPVDHGRLKGSRQTGD